MQKDYYDMTDREKLIYVLEDIGISFAYSGVSGADVTAPTDNDYEVEFGFNEDDSFKHFVAY